MVSVGRVDLERRHVDADRAKKTGSVRWVSSSPGPAAKPGAAWAIPSLISSRLIAGQPTAAAILRASVVLPDPGGPATTTRVGTGVTAPPGPPARIPPGQSARPLCQADPAAVVTAFTARLRHTVDFDAVRD